MDHQTGALSPLSAAAQSPHDSSASPRRATASKMDEYHSPTQKRKTTEAVSWLASSPEYRSYAKAQEMNAQFKACFWLAIVAMTVCCYLDAMIWLVNPIPNRYYYTHDNHRYTNPGPNDAPLIGSIVRTASSMWVAVGGAALVALFILPWTILGIYSSADENPREHTFSAYIVTQARAYFLLQAVGPSIGVKLDVPPFLSTGVISGQQHQDSGFVANLRKLFQQQRQGGAGGGLGGIFKFIASDIGMMRTIAAIGVPCLVIYFMFWRRFVCFWKLKTIVHRPWLTLAPQIGLVLVFLWWLVGSAATAKTLDGTLSFLINDSWNTFIDALKHPNGKSRELIRDFCASVYSALLPYAASLWFASILPDVLGHIIYLLSPSTAQVWMSAMATHIGLFGFFWNYELLTSDIATALIIGIIFLFLRAPRQLWES